MRNRDDLASMGSREEPLQIWFESLLDAKMPICRYPHQRWRSVIRWLLRRGSVGGQELVFLNLARGLDRLGVAYVVNDYARARRHPEDLICLIGKPHLLERRAPKAPLLLGSAAYSHPCDAPGLLDRYDVRRILVPGEWMRQMCEPFWGARVHAWPVGIDTDWWKPSASSVKDIDVLIYDKLRWPSQRERRQLIDAAIVRLESRGLKVVRLVYGTYREPDYHALLARTRCMVFLCEHETQGLAYLEALSSNVPLLAWNGTRLWTDPNYYPRRVQFSPVTAVPYWDERCGWKIDDFASTLSSVERFWEAVHTDRFAPREFVLEQLTLEQAARQYLEHVRASRLTPPARAGSTGPIDDRRRAWTQPPSAASYSS